MLQPVFEFFNKLIDEFSWNRLIFVIVTFVVIAISLYMYEKKTSHFALSKAEKTIQLLKQISSLPEDIKGKSKTALTNATSSVASRLQEIANTETLSIAIHPNLQKFMAAFSPWLFVILLVPSMKQRQPKALVFGFLICGLSFGGVSIFIPPDNPNWVNYWLYPLGHFFIVLFLLWLFGKKKALTI